MFKKDHVDLCKVLDKFLSEPSDPDFAKKYSVFSNGTLIRYPQAVIMSFYNEQFLGKFISAVSIVLIRYTNSDPHFVDKLFCILQGHPWVSTNCNSCVKQCKILLSREKTTSSRNICS